MLDLTPEIIGRFKNNGITLFTAYPSDSENINYPCVTYSEYANTDNAVGDNVGYSDISYKFEIWSQSTADRVRLAKSVDTVMKALRFKRTMAETQFLQGLYRYIMVYSRTVYENYEEEK